MNACSARNPTWLVLLAGAAISAASATTGCSSHAPGPGDKTNGGANGPSAGERPPRKSDALSQLETIASAEEGRNGAVAASLYDPEKIVQIHLTLDDAAIAILSSADPADAKTWVHAKLECDDAKFADVGVRLKGTSTRRQLPAKAALKVKLNKWVKGQKLGDIESLTLNNMVSDPTFVAERVAYHVFRSLSLPAERANTAHVTINGQDYGLYANIETPDENFLARAFGEKTRSLYEVNWGSAWVRADGPEVGFEIDVPAPGAPPGTMPDAELLFDAVEAAKDETLLDDLAARLDTKQWLRFVAAEAMVSHIDGYAYALWGSHNYFLSGDRGAKFSLIPWSTDDGLSSREGVLDAANPAAGTVFARCRQSTACWDAYKLEMKSVLDVYETLDLVNLAHKWHDQIDALVRTDPKREATLEYYESETAILYDFLAARPSVIRAQLGL